MSQITVEQLREIVELTNTVPDEYRQKCFELLLGHALRASAPSPVNSPLVSPPAQLPATPSNNKPFIIPIDVKAFLSQYNLNESILWKLFLVESNEIRHTYQLQGTKKATTQIQHALMMALESALTTGQFQTEVDALRTRCVDHKCYDETNFSKNIKNNSKFFKSTSEPTLYLSPDGKSELADLIEKLTGQNG